ncbi:MAG TPA: HEAT repeat domain-containing protein [Spirochaetes bacterium]|nr:HEAT repeat domain-containing protein [Spirochaetota bacterium]
MEKDFLQSLKIDISRNFKLVPYERISFHKVLGLARSDNGMRVLLRELDQEREIRESALQVLTGFDQPEVLAALMERLGDGSLSDQEKLYVLEYIERRGGAEQVTPVMEFIQAYTGDPSAMSLDVVAGAYECLRVLGKESPRAGDFFMEKAKTREGLDEIRMFGIMGLSSFRDITLFEELLKEGDDETAFHVYKAIALMSENLVPEKAETTEDEDIPYTFTADKEDRHLLNIRVLLGKMTSHFDGYSRNTKSAFICAMISSNHREFLIYTMKALTSEDTELIDLVLHLLLANVGKLRDPDKLFRNLLALTADTDRKNDMIVNIIEAYFVGMNESRKNAIFRDKLFNYIVVTLDTYFETYRREFMVTEVAEKSYPESFQKIRKYILEHLSPGLKKKVSHFLRNGDRSTLKAMLSELAKHVPYIEGEYREKVELLVEILFDEDAKSRVNSAVRIEDINFEKKYLRNRIVRICDLIGRLRIEEAATSLVKIYNYVKKYPDEDISDAVTYCLSMLNYSYLQGELEVMLMSGDAEDRAKAVKYLSLFADQRSMNIMLDYIKSLPGDGDGLLLPIMEILLRRDMYGNMTASSIFKGLIENSPDDEIRRLAFLCLGKVGVESDIEYLDGLFAGMERNDMKEAIVQSITTIVHLNSGINRRQVVKTLLEYLKDPSIRVRIYSCMLLIQMGNKEALKFIRDMMIIKNKAIQRDVLSLIGNQRSVEFSYFLISLLKEEYGISGDILPVLELMPAEEIQEIDHFIVNIFKKHEGGDVDIRERGETAPARTGQSVSPGWAEKTVLYVEIGGFSERLPGMRLMNLIINSRLIADMFVNKIQGHNGLISSASSGTIIALFEEPFEAATAAMEVQEMLGAYNRARLHDRRIRTALALVTQPVKILGNEIILFPRRRIKLIKKIPVRNRAIIDKPSYEALEHNFNFEGFPESVFPGIERNDSYYELMSPVNSALLLENILSEISRRERERIEASKRLEEDIRKRKQEINKSSSIEYAQAMDEIGKMLKEELDEMLKYIQKRSTDRDLITNVEQRVSGINKMYLSETTKIMM